MVCQGLKRILSPPFGIDIPFLKWYSFVNGELSERFKEPVLKTGDGETHREFESHTLRQEMPSPYGGGISYSVRFEELNVALIWISGTLHENNTVL